MRIALGTRKDRENMALLDYMSSRIDKEKTKKNIALILEKLKADADPQVLNEYRSIFKKEVSLFRRSWAAAYLLMCFEQSGNGFRGGLDRPGKNRKPQPETRSGGQKDNGNASEKTREKRQYPLAEEDSKRIFISIGRNRRVFPREILGLIIGKTGVSRDDVGAIRILENYSFVQVRDTIAERIINALDGYLYRGRTLAVNFAKNRKDDDENPELQERSDAPVEDVLFTDNSPAERSGLTETDGADQGGDNGASEQGQD
jgi:hypothetical protein